MAVRTKVEFKGPFFAHDPGKTFRQNIRVFMGRVAEEAETAIRREMGGNRAAISHDVQPSHSAQHVRGRVQSLRGKPWAMTAVVSVNNAGLSKAQGIALMAAAARVESQTKAFRRVGTGMRRSRAEMRAELLKGLQ